MALAPDAFSNSGAQNSNAGASWNHTCTGQERVLVVGIGFDTTTLPVTSVTYGGVPLTRADGINNATNVGSEVWTLVDPPAGTALIAVAFGGANYWGAIAMSFTGAKLTGHVNDTNTTAVSSGSPSDTPVSTIPNTYAFNFLAFDASGQTFAATSPSVLATGSNISGTWNTFSASYQSALAAGSIVMAYTGGFSSPAALTSVVIAPSGGEGKLVPRNSLRPRIFGPGLAR